MALRNPLVPHNIHLQNYVIKRSETVNEFLNKIIVFRECLNFHFSVDLSTFYLTASQITDAINHTNA